MFYNKYPEARAEGMIYSLGNPSRDLNKDSFGCLYIPLKRETEYSSLAQSVEHAAVNRVVVGSSPTRGAKKRKTTQSVVFLFCFMMEDLKGRSKQTVRGTVCPSVAFPQKSKSNIGCLLCFAYRTAPDSLTTW